ncbi:UDP-2,3-diacylglucosamine diphosphatase [Phaeocystidibacter luteus]|uniref:UDP-2,3-diacylglucosamine diphosphatase n=1 Tax=Phaeocystidibacter luteus TaxID=911197 RepID=A0A6N6RCP9_9FLAO|nr:UDP-2,3-diacylglucosamine diphosphatase [Phaeocystidibacter luteus]KAB2805355.1 UDP-2,3-diacylglucosamine diphosphatase [Phaeocystidibacter luteus]
MGDKVYFISDLHLGAPDAKSSRERELRFVKWLEEIRKDAKVLYVVGDLFDFWFEYKRAVPRGFTRAIGKLAELSDAGIEIHLFTGNHDLWIFDYLPEEIGAELHRAPIEVEHGGKKFMIGHGDGLGPGDHGYKFIKKIFTNRFLQWCYARVHPNFGIWLADRFSKKSRQHTGGDDAIFKGEENEWLYQYCKEVLEDRHIDYFVFGHRHLPLDLKVGEKSRYINLGDWIQYYTYGVFDGDMRLLEDGNSK